MLIDWFTVIAQVVNFLILMWLLKRFLYKPILNAIDEREARIAETVRKAEEEKKAAETEHEELRRKNEAFEIERVGILAKAQEEAKEAGRQLLAKEREHADASREKWREALVAEQSRFGDEVAARVREEVFANMRRAFGDLADESLEDRMAEVFVRRLRDAKETLAGMAGTPPAFLVKTAFEPSEKQRDALRRAFADALPAGSDIAVTFQTEPRLVGGVELIAGGRKLVWALGDYMEKLEDSVSGMLTIPAPAPASGAETRKRTGGTEVRRAPARTEQ